MEHRPIEIADDAAQYAAGDDRAAPRFTLLIRAAKLIAPQGEFICVIRDASAGGISLRGFHRLPDGAPLALELQTGERHAIEPIWHRGGEAGYRFVEPVDVVRLVAEAGRYPKRQIRLGLRFPIDLAVAGRLVEGEVVNISQQGARIVCTERLAIAQPLRILAGILPEVRALVRWRDAGEYGLVFDDTFSLSQLARFAAAAQAPELLGDTDRTPPPFTSR